MVGKLQKWGNSLALRIPKAMADDLELGENAAVDVRLENGTIIVVPARSKKFDINTLVDQITRENVHAEVDWRQDVGAERIP